METTDKKRNDKLPLIIIGIVSILIPIVVALLLFIPQTGKLGDLDVSFLPRLNAVINFSSAIALILGYYFVKKKQIDMHKLMMTVAFVLGGIFLVSYVVYHFQGGHTVFGDVNHDGVLSAVEKENLGLMRTFYLVILLSHILLSAGVVPLVLLAIYFAITDQINKHKRIVKFTYPVWLYVAITGVVVYLMISPYYI
ncbi:DUF420 domain-containing protein [Flammeovirga kamogawensis]|uniref:DUF420 domain-containing protein n=1 Tax=Flammeovirga kamogawensis TaxID=373891 RepID=A0ABX8GW47_9BACT|nr:DUF420 domain-containing protein [Flammeovirga kamogawensis]MBB6461269.1 putative membrane protein [Flammeovirga kamogawensis]QWG07828.1 DUF420 domain-containing protein [Flammeovirga kamogawensis]TRX69633.1 DUF420 domain-containing protein [Flammeovirga kamogawensis]